MIPFYCDPTSENHKSVWVPPFAHSYAPLRMSSPAASLSAIAPGTGGNRTSVSGAMTIVTRC